MRRVGMPWSKTAQGPVIAKPQGDAREVGGGFGLDEVSKFERGAPTIAELQQRSTAFWDILSSMATPTEPRGEPRQGTWSPPSLLQPLIHKRSSSSTTTSVLTTRVLVIIHGDVIKLTLPPLQISKVMIEDGARYPRRTETVLFRALRLYW
ncbi:hypothetical protein ONZ45_g15704 [Pleurotus djamor]|nr:hypothetical protein ONZ45_g15704 [Pleurotus djamor]